MGKPNVARTLSSLVVVLFVSLCAASCGTQDGSKFDGGAKNPGDFDGSIAGNGDGGPFFQTGNDASGTQTSCTPLTCASQGFTCGINRDGCGGAIQCGSCTAPAYCGGGGPSQCGTGVVSDGGTDGGGTFCTPLTCAGQGFDCGATGDGCGGTITCGPIGCGAGFAFCGGGGPNKCGGTAPVGVDGGKITPCVPTTCAALGFNCGPAGDGCGGMLDCNVGNAPCVSPAFCGGGGPGVCGGNNGKNADGGILSTCVPTTCAALGYNCGPAGDGCGGVLDCNAGNPPCVSPQFCGGGGASLCGGSNGKNADGGALSLCVPTTCAALGFTCGPAGDGCGHALDCGSCGGADTCGGGGAPGQCGHTCPLGGLCLSQSACPAGVTTTLTGTVRAGVSAWLSGNPQTPDPVPNVLVYVPTDPAGTLSPISQGYTASVCPTCAADVSGNPLVSTYTDFDGTFTLKNVPVGASIPVVVQMGRWRREVMVAVNNRCAANSADINLPRNKTDGLFVNIPLTAISTGNVDALECVLLKMGIDQAEFTSSTGNGRIHIYGAGPNTYVVAPNGNNQGYGPGAYIANNMGGVISLPEHALMGNGGTFLNYDQIMFPCWGHAVAFTPPSASNGMRTPDEPPNLVTYGDRGGHFFATHYSYAWLVGNGTLNNAATWNPDANNPGAVTWTLNVQPNVPPSPPAPHVGTFAKWLNLVSALSTSNPAGPVPTPATVSIANPRYDVSAVLAGSVDWIDGQDQDVRSMFDNHPLVEHFTFDTPVGGPNTCGHAIFSDFHVTSAGNSNIQAFPTECNTNALTAQERILEYMIWDLGACVSPPPPPVCNKLTCAAQHIGCGPAGDGCGNPLDCGACVAPLTCGGGGVDGQCGQPDAGTCAPHGCPANIQCGPWADGCGGAIASCGTCPPGTTCGGGGVNGMCGAPDAGVCVPQACPANIQCGPFGDGCGNAINCGTCPPGTTCGGGGVNGMCGSAPDGGVCVPQGCPANVTCGPAGDGCGNLIASCGTCPTGQSCGGAGVNGQCGGCIPLTCQELGYNCGPAGDGCGGALDCGPCPVGQSCGGGGVDSVCGARAPPK